MGTIGRGCPANRWYSDGGARRSQDDGSRGNLDDWRASVAQQCSGNSRLVLALASAFAAPCLHLAGQEGGGLHLRGPSSCGKSTVLALAASVYGPPEYRREWRASDNGLEGVAALHCDALLPLDEIGQLDPRHAAGAAYLLSNGQGKSRSRRDGSLRAPATWRVLFVSCGEVGLGDLIAEAGGKLRAGMDVRLIDVPAEAGAGTGIFDRIPDGLTAGTFADGLKVSASRHYGTAFPAFLQCLVTDLERARRFLREGTDKLTRELCGNDSAGQVRRVASRFALIGCAGALATAYGITGWDQGEAERATRRCFSDWLNARGGNGEREPREMVKAVQLFIELHSEGRFSPAGRAGDDRAQNTKPRRVSLRGRIGTDRTLVLPNVWRTEVCKGFDPSAVARLLVERGLLIPGSSGEFQRSERVKGTGEKVRVYRLAAGILDAEA
ncbi:MAG: DUF927 domain-containing protein [Ahniella sp.]|nr:DUF927 domain-containing protein [Ahniella sp.]